LHILSVNGRKKNCTYKMITQQKNIGTLNWVKIMACFGQIFWIWTKLQ
jgi:hypothetical protein